MSHSYLTRASACVALIASTEVLGLKMNGRPTRVFEHGLEYGHTWDGNTWVGVTDTHPEYLRMQAGGDGLMNEIPRNPGETLTEHRIRVEDIGIERHNAEGGRIEEAIRQGKLEIESITNAQTRAREAGINIGDLVRVNQVSLYYDEPNPSREHIGGVGTVKDIWPDAPGDTYLAGSYQGPCVIVEFPSGTWGETAPRFDSYRDQDSFGRSREFGSSFLTARGTRAAHGWSTTPRVREAGPKLIRFGLNQISNGSGFRDLQVDSDYVEELNRGATIMRNGGVYSAPRGLGDGRTEYGNY